ncbi:siderophore-interacting protein [Corynebacterium mendelii]|uniref:Siderophore-interacting protein n=1 Tax=Corynebacterium mendelii TaxID=2765362 RepID=A0A939DZF9_9CORY|nr:siderophore-interacting protein [Corynebacterium mendelii]MBN9644094.1 siderophore-interacting protein [Corynebacterium mendelii]
MRFPPVLSAAARRGVNALGTKLYPLVIRAYQAWAKRNMAVPEPSRDNRVFPVTVTAVETVAPRLKRLTLHADQFTEITTRYDEYFGLLIPPAGRRLVLPEATDTNIRAALAAIDEADRPDMRIYTVRSHDREAGEITVDMVTHGHSGPGSSFALDAKPGDVVGYRSRGVSYLPNPGPQLLVADPTALPAVHAIVEQLDDTTRAATTVVAVIDDHDCVEKILPQLQSSLAGLVIIDADEQTANDKLTQWLIGNVTDDLTFAWICAEQSLAATGRRTLVKQLGVEKTNIMFCGYWKRGKARA